MNELPAIPKYTLRFYDALRSHANVETINGHEIPIYRGPISKLWNEIGASNSYYSRVMNNLVNLECISVLVRGSANVESVVALLHRPHADEIPHKKPLTTRRPDATMVTDLEAVKRNIGGINIVEAFKNLEDRVSKLEREVKQLGKTKANNSD